MRPDGTVTAVNASGLNDSACALLIASGGGGEARQRADAARAIVAMAVAGVPPRVMGSDRSSPPGRRWPSSDSTCPGWT